jgi:hypothetical protein
LTNEQKDAFMKGQLQDMKDKYGNADIYFKVTTGTGSSTGSEKDLGLQKGALNVFVSDKVGTGNSEITHGFAVSWVNQNFNHLNTEIGHQFAGDTRGFSDWAMHAFSFGGMGAQVMDAFADSTNDLTRYNADPNHITAGRNESYIVHDLAVDALNRGARDFQKAITPTTK